MNLSFNHSREIVYTLVITHFTNDNTEEDDIMRNAHQLRGYIGTYTKGESKGIYSFTLHTQTAALENIKAVAELENPTYLTTSANNRFLYSVMKEGEFGGIAAYSIDEHTGELTFLNKQLTEGTPPCHVSVGQHNKNAFAAYYHRGIVESYLLNEEDDSIQPLISRAEHHGSGPDPRQEKSHIHFAAFTPDENRLVAIDLGGDCLYTYKVTDGLLTDEQSLTVKAGSGPRHLVFHPHKKFAYLMTEFSSEVIVLTYDEGTGNFTELQYISTLPADFSENNQGSAIHISADGKFVYAGNRGHNSIAVFAVNETTGFLTFVEHVSTEGNWPRDFSLDPTEQYVIAANQESNNLTLFARDALSGKLTLIHANIAVPSPVCIKFLHVD